jgi:hypothetical protein
VRTLEFGPDIEVVGLKPGQVLKDPAWIEAIVKGLHSRWPIKRGEFFMDGNRTRPPDMLNNEE